MDEHYLISKCGSRNCKTCNLLLTESTFTSELTRKSYHTHTHENLNCQSSNVVYGIECTLCGLIYVGETKGQLRKRINGHRYEINHGGNQLVYQHFNQVDHSILCLRVHVLEKIYHRTNNPTLSTPFRRQREEHWIRELGTAAPYGCNDRIDSIGNLTSPGCRNVNVMSLFNSQVRRRRSHGHRHYNPPHIHNVSFDDLVGIISRPLGIHHIRSKLFSVPLSVLICLREECHSRHVPNSYSLEYKLQWLILDICKTRLFKPVSTSCENTDTKHFLRLHFHNKGLDFVNLSNILHHKTVQTKVPTYYNDKSPALISYTYTPSIAPLIFNHKKTLKDVTLDDIKSKPPSCDCSTSPFRYSPSGHVVTGDLNIVSDDKLRHLLAKGPKYRIPQSFNWNHNFKIIMDAVEDYAVKWAKREKAEVESLSEWIKAIRNILKARIRHLRAKVNTRVISIFDDPSVKECLSGLHEKYVIVPADKASNNIVFVCKQYYVECLVNELGLNTTTGNSAYTLTGFSKGEVIANHTSALLGFGITDDIETDLPLLYWIPKLHKNPYKQRYIAGSAKCSTKSLSKILTTILSTVMGHLQSYCETAYSRNGINQMWILKNSKALLESLAYHQLTSVTDIKTYDFSTLYTTIPHSDLKNRLKALIHTCFFTSNGKRKFSYLVIGHNSSYFVKEHTDSSKKYTEEDVVSMISFLIDNIFVMFGEKYPSRQLVFRWVLTVHHY